MNVYDQIMCSMMYYFMYHADLRVSEICISSTSEHVIQYNSVNLSKDRKNFRIKLLSYKHSSTFKNTKHKENY